MKKIILLAGLLMSSGSFAMSADCKIAHAMFEDSGLVMVDGISMAINDGEKLTNTTVSYDEYSVWYKKVYSKKMNSLTNKYSKYKDVESNNPIYLGFVSILELDNFTNSLNNYMKTHDKSDLSDIKSAKSRIESAFSRLEKDCGKKYER